MQSITSHKPITTSQRIFEVAEILAAGILRARHRQVGDTNSFSEDGPGSLPKPSARGENQ
jgi:hypothetical protein